MQGDEVLKKIESAGDEEGRPLVTVKIINCGELKEGKSAVILCVLYFEYFNLFLCICLLFSYLIIFVLNLIFEWFNFSLECLKIMYYIVFRCRQKENTQIENGKGYLI